MEFLVAVLIFDLLVWIVLLGSVPFCRLRKQDFVRNSVGDFTLYRGLEGLGD